MPVTITIAEALKHINLKCPSPDALTVLAHVHTMTKVSPLRSPPHC